MRYSVTFEGALEGQQDARALQGRLDAVMEALLAAGAEDPAIGAVGSEGTVEITVTVPAAGPDEAVNVASALLRDAVRGETEFDWRWARASRVAPVGA